MCKTVAGTQRWLLLVAFMSSNGVVAVVNLLGLGVVLFAHLWHAWVHFCLIEPK